MFLMLYRFSKKCLFVFLGVLIFIAGEKIVVSFWNLVLLNVFDLINA